MSHQDAKVTVTPPRCIKPAGPSFEHPTQRGSRRPSSDRTHQEYGTLPPRPGRRPRQNGELPPAWDYSIILLRGPFAPNYPKHSILDEDENHHMAEEISRLTGANVDELQIILSADFPLPTQHPCMAKAEAIETLRILNDRPQLMLSQNRLAALDRVRHVLVTNNELHKAPIRHIAAGLFPDLDTGLFNNQLFRRVFVGESDYAEGMARTDMVGRRGLRISLSSPFYDQAMRDKPGAARIKDAVTSLIHEMCHAYIIAHCGWRVCEDVVYCGRGGPEPHGIYFGQVLHLVQKVLDFVDWRFDLSEDGRYPMYELRKVPRGGSNHVDQESPAFQGGTPSDHALS